MHRMSKQLALKLKAARKKQRLSQSQAAQAWGIPLPTLKKWETEQRTPRGLALQLLLERLDAIMADQSPAAKPPTPARKPAK